MTNSQHAVGLGENYPTPAQHKELFAQEALGNMTKDKMQKILKGQFLSFENVVSFDRAREILGEKNFFGPVEWYKYFPKLVDMPYLSGFPKIPWSERELINLPICQKHFLFLGIETLDGKLLSPIFWSNFLPYLGYNLRFDLQNLGREDYTKKTCRFRWYLMPFGVFPGSTDHFLNEQTKILGNLYERPILAERFTGNVLCYILNNFGLDNNVWAITNDSDSVGIWISLICFRENTLCLGSDTVRMNKEPNIGIAASMKLPIKH